MPSGFTLADARAAYCGTNANAISNFIGLLGNFNTSGDNVAWDPGISATAQASKSQANIPAWDNPTNPH